MTVPRPSPPRSALPPEPAALPDASEAPDLGVLALRSQSRSDDRAATMLELMAIGDPRMRDHHLAAAARFRRRAESCRDRVGDRRPVRADGANGA